MKIEILTDHMLRIRKDVLLLNMSG